jgi:hypothetical protein
MRSLAVLHRWLGVATCLLCVMWLLSGLVMLYVAFPSWSSDERIALLPAVDVDQVRIPPADALRRAGISSAPATFRLEMLGLTPVYRFAGEDKETSLSAVTGEIIDAVSIAAAKQHVEAAFAGDKPQFREEIDYDQWTVTRRYDPHRPLLKFALSDPVGTIVYVSSKTGEIVQNTTRTERFWNWFGAIPHWIYFAPLRKDQELWRQLIMWLSGPLAIGVVTGLWLGVRRLRWRKRDAEQSVTPYRGWLKWHHFGGLAGGLFLAAWIGSGWLSVNPFDWFTKTPITEFQRAAFAGWSADLFDGISLAAIAKAGSGAKEVSFISVASRPLMRSHSEHGTTLLDARSLAPAALDEATLVEAATRAIPDARITDVEWLTAETLYWYSHQTKRPLPVLRIAFDDPAATWLFIDATRGDIAGSSDRSSRAYRWLFNFAHRYDLPALLRSQPSRDILIWLLSLMGLVIAASGVKLASRALRNLLSSNRWTL